MENTFPETGRNSSTQPSFLACLRVHLFSCFPLTFNYKTSCHMCFLFLLLEAAVSELWELVQTLAQELLSQAGPRFQRHVKDSSTRGQPSDSSVSPHFSGGLGGRYDTVERELCVEAADSLRVLTLSLVFYITLCGLLNLSEPQFLHLYIGTGESPMSSSEKVSVDI